MSKAMIVTVGAQIDQIVFSLTQIKPDYLGLLATNTAECRAGIDQISQKFSLPATRYKVLYTADNPEEIGKLINNFNELYEWLRRTEGICEKELVVDPTGGRKWMSAGVTMFASFLGLDMIYVDVHYVNNKPDPATMRVIKLANAYQQAGFLEEHKADTLCNTCNFKEAGKIYEFLSEKLMDNRRVLIKKDIADGYLSWTNFCFEAGYNYLLAGLKKIRQYRIFLEHEDNIEKQVNILSVLKKNEEIEGGKGKYSYFELLKDSNFSGNILLFLYVQQGRYAENNQFEQAIILLYRILEFIGQYRLSKYDIDTSNIHDETKKSCNEKFKKLTKQILGGERELPDQIGLLESWTLLCCLEDELFKDEGQKNSLCGLRGKTQPRNLLWMEHGNKNADSREYEKFRDYVRDKLKKINFDLEGKIREYQFVRF